MTTLSSGALRSGQRSTVPARRSVARRHVVAVVDLLLREGPLWRAELAERTGLSRATVTRLTTELLDAGVIFEEAPAPTRTAHLGRPPTLLRVNPRAGGMIGVDIGASNIRVAAADLGGTIVLRREQPSHAANGRAITVSAIVRLIKTVVDDALQKGIPVRGLGVGVPSLTSDKGVVLNAPGLGWANLPLGAMLEEALGFLTVVDNDVNLAAVGRICRGRRQRVTGPRRSNGRYRRGCRDRHRRPLVPRRPPGGRRDRLHAPRPEVSGTALPGLRVFRGADRRGRHRRAGPAALGTTSDKERAKWPEDLAQLSSADVFSRRTSSRLAALLVEETVDYLALGVANIACVLNPDRIVLGGGVVDNNPDLVDAVRSRIEDKLPDPPALLPAALGEDAGVIGAIMLAKAAVFGRTILDGESLLLGPALDGRVP